MDFFIYISFILVYNSFFIFILILFLYFILYFFILQPFKPPQPRQ